MNFKKVPSIIMKAILASADGEITVGEIACVLEEIFEATGLPLGFKIPEEIEKSSIKVISL